MTKLTLNKVERLASTIPTTDGGPSESDIRRAIDTDTGKEARVAQYFKYSPAQLQARLDAALALHRKALANVAFTRTLVEDIRDAQKVRQSNKNPETMDRIVKSAVRFTF